MNRPDRAAGLEIFSKYLTADLPFHASMRERYGSEPAVIARRMIEDTIERIDPKLLVPVLGAHQRTIERLAASGE